MRRCVLAVALASCTPIHAPAPDAGAPVVATGRRLVDHAADVGGITNDGYVAFSDTNADGHSVAKVIPIGGGAETVIATSDGTGKADVRFEVWGDVVFAWTDRGNRMATMYVWSAATGVSARGTAIRPGRAAASADGTAILYERDVTTTSANIVTGPLAGPDTMIDVANAQDQTCWQDTDFAQVGSHLLVRYCPMGGTAFALRSVGADGAFTDLSLDAVSAAYGSSRAVWLDSAGTLSATDGAAVTQLATGAADFTVTHDLAHAAVLTTGGAIEGLATDGTDTPHTLVAAPEAMQLGALSPDGQSVLFASQVDDRGGDNIAPYTDVRASVPGARELQLVAGTTSCPACLYDSFSADGSYAFALDPIDNSAAADGAGPIHVYALADGHIASTFGTYVFTAIALGGTGTASRVMFVDAVRDATQIQGWAYGLTVASLDGAPPVEIARTAGDFALDHGFATAVISFGGDGDTAGVWVVPLAQQ